MLELLLAANFIVNTAVATPQVVLPTQPTVQEIQIPKGVHRKKQIQLRPSQIPVQVPISNKKYEVFRKHASKSVSEYTSECAKFVNRIFSLRFGRLIFGDAWTMQLHPDNQKFLKLIWRLDESEFIRDKSLALKNNEDRIKHFQKLYKILDQEKTPIGVIGFVYRFSFWRDHVAKLPNVLPQTHIAFLAGQKEFFFENDSDQPQSLEKIITEKFGQVHDFEQDFVNERVNLSKVLQPKEKYFYDDYLIEEQFKKVTAGSLLELFLRKHRNNRITPLLRPVSFSRISDELAEEIKHQKKILQSLGPLDFISGKKYAEKIFPTKDRWNKNLKTYFQIENPEKALLVPIPKLLKVPASA